MITTDDAEVARRARAYRSFGAGEELCLVHADTEAKAEEVAARARVAVGMVVEVTRLEMIQWWLVATVVTLDDRTVEEVWVGLAR